MQADEVIAEVWSSFDDCLREDDDVLCVLYLHDRAELIERFYQPPNKIIQELSSSSKSTALLFYQHVLLALSLEVPTMY